MTKTLRKLLTTVAASNLNIKWHEALFKNHGRYIFDWIFSVSKPFGSSSINLLLTANTLLQAKEKKKVGRPLAYKGDPNAPELTELERRRIKRRIANRESARRVRHKRQEILEEMQAKVSVEV